MHQVVKITITSLALVACAGSQSRKSFPAAAATPGAEASPMAADLPRAGDPAGANEFVLTEPAAEDGTREESSSAKLQSTRTEAAIRFTVVDRDKGPIKGIVISLTGADGRKFYTEETDDSGFSEVLVPVGQKYDLIFLSLGRRDVAAKVTVSDEPKQNINLTLRYKRHDPPAPPVLSRPGGPEPDAPRFVLKGVTFDSGKATVRPESFARLDTVVEYLMHKKRARIEISGHTDNAGNSKINRALSQKRALACRDYLISKGVSGSRIDAIGYGDERPIAPNDTEEGRQQNRRIEVIELD